MFIQVADLLDYLRSTYAPSTNTTYDELFDKIRNIPLLVLDDYGERTATPWSREKLYQIINHRYNARLPTVITTSLSLRKIEKEIDRRISSRMADPTVSTSYAITAPGLQSR